MHRVGDEDVRKRQLRSDTVGKQVRLHSGGSDDSDDGPVEGGTDSGSKPVSAAHRLLVDGWLVVGFSRHRVHLLEHVREDRECYGEVDGERLPCSHEDLT